MRPPMRICPALQRFLGKAAGFAKTAQVEIGPGQVIIAERQLYRVETHGVHPGYAFLKNRRGLVGFSYGQ